MKRKVLALMASLAVAFAAILMVASPAAAEGPSCVWHTLHTTSFGQAKSCATNVFTGADGLTYRNMGWQYQDTVTDGACVHIEWKTGDGVWHENGTEQSCSAVVTNFREIHDITIMRFVKGSPYTCCDPDGVGPYNTWFQIWPD